MACLVQNDPFGQRLARIPRHAHLAFGQHAGGKVEDEGRTPVRRTAVHWHRRRKRIRPQLPLHPSIRRDQATRPRPIAKRQPNQIRLGRHRHPLPHPANVVAVVERRRRHAVGLRLGNAHLHGKLRPHLPKATPRIYLANRPHFFGHHRRRLRVNPPRLNRCHILHRADHPMRIMPRQIGRHQRLSYANRIRLRRLRRDKNRLNKVC